MIILAYDSDGVWLSDGKSNGSLWHNNTKISYDDTSYKKYFGGDCGLTLYKVNDVLWNSVNGNYENLPAPTFPNNIGKSSQNTTIRTVLSTISGKWAVTIPANYKLICYDSASTAKNSTYYIAAKTLSYTLTCTQQASLSNGKTRYFFVSGDGKNLWFDYTSGMSVVPSTTTAATSYTVTFNPNGGSISQASKVVAPGQKYGVLPMPSWDGYTFDGWFTLPSGGTQVTAATTVTLTGNQTLYAHWTKNPTATYTVTFDPNGGSVYSASSTRQVETQQVKVSDTYTE